MPTTGIVIEAVRSFGINGCTSNEVLERAGINKNSNASSVFLEMLNHVSSNRQDSEFPIIRRRKKTETRYVHRAFISNNSNDTRICSMCYNPVSSWHVLGDLNHAETSNNESTCEICYRKSFADTMSKAEIFDVGYAVHQTLNEPETLDDVPGLHDENASYMINKIKKIIASEVSKCGGNGCSADDIVEKLSSDPLVETLDDFQNIVRWILYESSSASHDSTNALFRLVFLNSERRLSTRYFNRLVFQSHQTLSGIKLEIDTEEAKQSLEDSNKSVIIRIWIPASCTPVAATPTEDIATTHSVILRLYSDVWRLQDSLTAEYGHLVTIPTLPLDPQFDCKDSACDALLVHCLTQFLNVISAHPILAHSSPVSNFFAHKLEGRPSDYNTAFTEFLTEHNVVNPLDVSKSISDALSGSVHDVELMMSPRYEKMLASCCESIQRIQVAQSEMASTHHFLAKMQLGLAYLDAESTEVEQSREVTTLLKSLAKLNTRSAIETHRCTIGMQSIRDSMNAIHEDMQETTEYFKAYGDIFSRLHENREATRRDKQAWEDLRYDMGIEARRMVSSQSKGLVACMLETATAQANHARSQIRVWQDFMSTFGEIFNSDTVTPASELDTTTLDHSFAEKTWESYRDCVKSHSSWWTSIENVRMQESVSHGSFGRLQKAKFNGKIVLVKSFDASSDLAKQISSEMIRELDQLQHVKEHKNLETYLGVWMHSKKFGVVMEFDEWGALLDLLIPPKHSSSNITVRRGHRKQPVASKKFSLESDPKWRQKIAFQCALGMEALHSSKPTVLHGDLKTSKILISIPELQVKICDYGLVDFKRRIRSVQEHSSSAAWMAPEVILNGPFTKSSDVYSFGMVLWQMYSRANPYPIHHATELIFKVVQEHLRPDITENVPGQYRSLMLACWDRIPEQRPTFSEIKRILSVID